MNFRIQPAIHQRDHTALCKLFKTSEYTNAFSSPMFSNQETYVKGWIRAAMEARDGMIFVHGATCVRHKVREPKTKLYFITVMPCSRDHGVGEMLMRDLEEQTPHHIIELDVANENVGALRFYERLGYEVVGEAFNGHGKHLEKQL